MNLAVEQELNYADITTTHGGKWKMAKIVLILGNNHMSDLHEWKKLKEGMRFMLNNSLWYLGQVSNRMLGPSIAEEIISPE